MRKGQIEIKFLRTLTANSYSFENTTTEGVSAGYQYINSPPIGGEARKSKTRNAERFTAIFWRKCPLPFSHFHHARRYIKLNSK